MNILDNQLSNLLAEAGLNQSEQHVYLSGSQTTGKSSAELIKLTKMPRPTVMAALKTLRAYGLCQTHKRDGRSFIYVMQPPQVLKEYLGAQSRQIDKLMDSLDSLPAGNSHASIVIREANGQQEVQDMLELALRCKIRQWQIIAPHANALRFMPKDYTAYFKRVRQEREIVSQTLWEPATKGQKVPLRDVLMRKPRYVPSDIGKNIPSIMLAFDDMLLIIDGTTNPTAALIQNPSITATFKLIFEMAWRSAKD